MNSLQKRLSNFLTGFLPPTVIGVVLAIIGGHNTAVFCNTLTPAVGPSAGAFCIQGVWLPFWDALLLVPVGIGIGIWLAAPSFMLAAASFIAGSFLIANGTTPWLPMLLSQSYCTGDLFTCSDTGFGLVWFGLGVLLVYLAYPIAKYRSSDSTESLLWNKRVSGISLILTGAAVSILGFISMLLFAPVIACLAFGCSTSIFSINNIGYWISIIFGLILIALGLGLLALNSREETKKVLQAPEPSTSRYANSI
jgi:hypothetical protein